MDQKELIVLMELWQQTEPSIYKTNIRAICDSKGVKPRQIEESLHVTYNSARSYLNTSHTARIEFLTALKLANMLGVSVTDFLEN